MDNLIRIDLKGKSFSNIQYSLKDIVGIINDNPEITEMSFESDGISNSILLNGNNVGMILPMISDNEELYDPLKRKEVFHDGYDEDGKLIPKYIVEYWKKLLFKLLFSDNNLICSFIVLEINHTIKSDGAVIKYKLSRTPNWTKETPFVHPVKYYFNRLFKRSATSGSVNWYNSATDGRVTDFNISMSNGDHSCSVHPSQARNYRQWHSDYTINHFLFFSEYFDLPATLLNSLGTEKVPGAFASWHYHSFVVRIPLESIMKAYENISSDKMYYKDEDATKSHMPINRHWDGSNFKLERVKVDMRENNIFDDSEIEKVNKIIDKLNGGL